MLSRMWFISSLCFLTSVILCRAVPINREISSSEKELYVDRANEEYVNESVCVIDDVLYKEGDTIPSASLCERCTCRPPKYECEPVKCEVKPGCRALQRSNQCCPEYNCECEINGRIYQNGARIEDLDSPCKACYCQSGEISCTVIECYRRSDCEPRYVPGRCCPKYDHCPPVEPTPMTFYTTASSSSEVFNPTNEEITKDFEGVIQDNAVDSTRKIEIQEELMNDEPIPEPNSSTENFEEKLTSEKLNLNEDATDNPYDGTTTALKENDPTVASSSELDTTQIVDTYGTDLLTSNRIKAIYQNEHVLGDDSGMINDQPIDVGSVENIKEEKEVSKEDEKDINKDPDHKTDTPKTEDTDTTTNLFYSSTGITKIIPVNEENDSKISDESHEAIETTTTTLPVRENEEEGSGSDSTTDELTTIKILTYKKDISNEEPYTESTNTNENEEYTENNDNESTTSENVKLDLLTTEVNMKREGELNADADSVSITTDSNEDNESSTFTENINLNDLDITTEVSFKNENEEINKDNLELITNDPEPEPEPTTTSKSIEASDEEKLSTAGTTLSFPIMLLSSEMVPNTMDIIDPNFERSSSNINIDVVSVASDAPSDETYTTQDILGGEHPLNNSDPLVEYEKTTELTGPFINEEISEPASQNSEEIQTNGAETKSQEENKRTTNDQLGVLLPVILSGEQLEKKSEQSEKLETTTEIKESVNSDEILTVTPDSLPGLQSDNLQSENEEDKLLNMQNDGILPSKRQKESEKENVGEVKLEENIYENSNETIADSEAEVTTTSQETTTESMETTTINALDNLFQHSKVLFLDFFGVNNNQSLIDELQKNNSDTGEVLSSEWLKSEHNDASFSEANGDYLINDEGNNSTDSRGELQQSAEDISITTESLITTEAPDQSLFAESLEQNTEQDSPSYNMSRQLSDSINEDTTSTIMNASDSEENIGTTTANEEDISSTDSNNNESSKKHLESISAGSFSIYGTPDYYVTSDETANINFTSAMSNAKEENEHLKDYIVVNDDAKDYFSVYNSREENSTGIPVTETTTTISREIGKPESQEYYSSEYNKDSSVSISQDNNTDTINIRNHHINLKEDETENSKENVDVSHLSIKEATHSHEDIDYTNSRHIELEYDPVPVLTPHYSNNFDNSDYAEMHVMID